MIFARARRRLMALNVAVLVVIILVLGATILLLLNRVLLAVETASLQSDTARVAEEAGEPRDGSMGPHLPSPGPGSVAVLWDLSGQVVANPDHVATGALAGPAREAANGRASTVTVRLPGGQDVLVGSQQVRRHGAPAGAVQVVRSLAPVHAVEREAMAVVALASLGAIGLSLAASWFLAGRALVPIRRALERQRDFTADASHELRTPLSVLDTGIQVLRRHPEQTVAENQEVVDSMAGEARRMERLVSGLLALARADSNDAQLQLAEVDLADLVRGAAGDLAPVAEAGGVRIQTQAVQPARAWLDADRVRQLVVILLDNAIKFSPEGGTVEAGCHTRAHGALLEVADRGPGIPPEQREHVFERFHRADPSRTGSGTGLGLAIARWIVTAHGGSIALRDNEPGLRVEVDFPGPRAGRGAGVVRRLLWPVRRLRARGSVHEPPIWRR